MITNQLLYFLLVPFENLFMSANALNFVQNNEKLSEVPSNNVTWMVFTLDEFPGNIFSFCFYFSTFILQSNVTIHNIRSYFRHCQQQTLLYSQHFYSRRLLPRRHTIVTTFQTLFLSYYNLPVGPPTFILRSMLEDSKLYYLQTKINYDFP